MRYIFAVLALAAGLILGVWQADAADATIQDGSRVAFDYTLTVDGKVVDSSESKGPLEYTQGDGKLLPGLARQMEGLKVGDEREIEVKPEEAYGSADPKAFQEIPNSNLPIGLKPEVGMILEARDKDGKSFPARITEVKQDSIIVELNPRTSSLPSRAHTQIAAGKTLYFKVKIVSVK